MVLSNKKLKKKLRADLSESLAESEAKKNPQNRDSTETHRENSEAHHSLKSLLDSAVQKPRLSKREKRREKTVSSQEGASVANINGGSEGVEEQKKQRKKRKRDGDGGEGSENGASESVEPENAKKSKKKSKKKKNKKKKAADNVEVKKIVESEVVATGEQCMAETTKTSDSQEKVDASPKVYVGGIPYYSTEDDIRSFFEGCGSITEIDCMKFPDSGKFRGIAIISFKTEAAAKRALELDGADMGGLFLKIQLYKATRDAKATSDFSPAIVEGYNRIYIGNLSWDITEDELRKLFSDCNLSSIRFGEDKETGQFRGYAHVDFADSLSVTMALKLDQTSVRGRPVRIRCAVPKKVTKIDSKSVSTSEKADNGGVSSNSKPVPTNEKPAASISVPTSVEVDNGGASSVSGKIRRRTCYECGERGHLSSSCPKKQAADPINSSAS